jgi:hypothetical protein
MQIYERAAVECAIGNDSIAKQYLQSHQDMTPEEVITLAHESMNFSGRRQTIIICKGIVKYFAQVGVEKIPLLKFLHPENINIQPTSDEIAILLAQDRASTPGNQKLPFVVMKNLVINLLGDSISELFTALGLPPVGEGTPDTADTRTIISNVFDRKNSVVEQIPTKYDTSEHNDEEKMTIDEDDDNDSLAEEIENRYGYSPTNAFDDDNDIMYQPGPSPPVIQTTKMSEIMKVISTPPLAAIEETTQIQNEIDSFLMLSEYKMLDM